MIVLPIDDINKKAMAATFNEIEKLLMSDVLVYYGEIFDGVEYTIKQIIEDLHENRREKLYVILTTPGGSLGPVKRMVNIFRNFYSEVNFIVPDYAYSLSLFNDRLCQKI